ncbi:MAG: NYN domain-containing protein, partial [Betaproteobacteria bacterium]
HVDAFVIISGDSDFSPLVSKLRENNKTVIGVGVRSSTSDLLVGNCDEFIFYDDLVKAEEAKRKTVARKQADAANKKTADTAARKQKEQASRKPNEKKSANEDMPAIDAPEEARRLEAIELVVDTVEALLNEKDLDEVHASSVKNALKRRRPDFVESAYGYKAFGKILEDAEKRGLLTIQRHGQAVAVSLPA